MSEKIVEIKVFSQDIYLFVCRLTNQLTNNSCTLSEESFRCILNSQNVHLFVIYDTNETQFNPLNESLEKGTLVGMLTAGIYQTPTGHKAWLEDIVVDDKYRGLGYGEKIVEYAINFIQNLNVDTITLTSNPSRVAANKLYKKMGFEQYETNVYRMKL